MERSRSIRRSDDNLTSLRRRFETFRRETVPVVRVLEGIEVEVSGVGGGECVGGGGGMHMERIRGDGTIEEVWEGTNVAMDGFWVHDVLTTNRKLRYVEERDVAGYERWDRESRGGDNRGRDTKVRVGGWYAAAAGGDGGEGVALQYTNSEGVVEVHNGSSRLVVVLCSYFINYIYLSIYLIYVNS